MKWLRKYWHHRGLRWLRDRCCGRGRTDCVRIYIGANGCALTRIGNNYEERDVLVANSDIPVWSRL